MSYRAKDARAADDVIRCSALVVGWNGKGLLPPLDLTLRRGRLVAVIGRNGSGKTTWFKTILGEVPPVSGRIERTNELRHIAYVPQSIAFDALLPLSVWDVVMQGRLRGNNFLRPWPSNSDRQACAKALTAAGAADLRPRIFRDLSKGQRQRVMFARVLATEAELALLDEPTAAMDVVAERETLERLAALASEHGIAVVCISHTMRVAEDHADDVLLFDRAGEQVIFGPRAEVLAQPAYRRFLAGEAPDV